MFDIKKQTIGKRNKPDENPEAGPAAVEPTERASPPVTSSVTRTGPTTTTMIGPTISLKGELSGDEDLIIQGRVEGTISLQQHNLTIGDKGRIRADISANVVSIEGELQGDVTGHEKVIIKKTGNVRGNIVAPRVTLEDGAMFKGSIEMEPNARGAAPVPAAPTEIKTGPASAAAAKG